MNLIDKKWQDLTPREKVWRRRRNYLGQFFVDCPKEWEPLIPELQKIFNDTKYITIVAYGNRKYCEIFFKTYLLRSERMNWIYKTFGSCVDIQFGRDPDFSSIHSTLSVPEWFMRYGNDEVWTATTFSHANSLINLRMSKRRRTVVYETFPKNMREEFKMDFITNIRSYTKVPRQDYKDNVMLDNMDAVAYINIQNFLNGNYELGKVKTLDALVPKEDKDMFV